MILVVSDNSPLNVLVRLGSADLLPLLFGRVVIPPEVAHEMCHPLAPAEVQQFIARPPAWLIVQTPSSLIPLPHLDAGEAAAISLAIELGAVVLMDELDGRREAASRGLTVIGAVGVLERAANDGHVADLAAIHDRIRGLRFHVGDALLMGSLQRHLAFKASHQDHDGNQPM